MALSIMNGSQGKWQLLTSLKSVVIDPADVPTCFYYLFLLFI